MSDKEIFITWIYMDVRGNIICEMGKIEIRQRRKMVIPFLSVSLLLLLITAYGLFKEEYKYKMITKISFSMGVAILFYLSYSQVIKLLRNQPIIVLEEDSIVLNTKIKSTTIQKGQIEHLEVKHIEEVGYILIIKTKDTTHETNISWLEKTPDEINELIQGYKK